MSAETQTQPDRLNTFERRQFVLKRRIEGRSFRQIAEETVIKFGHGRLPNGWDERYAYKDLIRLLGSITDSTRQERKILRELELERLDSLWRVHFKQAMGGHGPAVDRCLKIMDRRAKLMGLDAPLQFAISDFEELALDVVAVIRAEVEDPMIRERIWRGLGFRNSNVREVGRVPNGREQLEVG